MWRMLILGTVLSVVLATLCRAELASAGENTVEKEALINVKFFLNKESCSLNDEVRDMFRSWDSVRNEIEDYDDLESYDADTGEEGEKVEKHDPLCPIQSVKKRSTCCAELYRLYGTKTREKKTAKCLKDAEQYFQNLEKETYHLEGAEKEYVEETLEKLEEAVANERELDYILEDEDEDADEDEDEDEHGDEDGDEDGDDGEEYNAKQMGPRKTKRMERIRRRKMKKALKNYLRTMKKAEVRYEHKGEKGVPKKVRAKYMAFRKKLRMWYYKELMGVFFKAVTQKWMACTMVSVGDVSVGYCADLELIDKQAKQLSRKAVLGYEVGRVSQKLASADVEQVVRRIGRRRRWRARRLTALRASVREAEAAKSTTVTFVDLLGDDEKSCLSADLSYSCYAICCDSMYFGSFFCQSTSHQCLG